MIKPIIQQKLASKILLNLTNVDFLDSSGIGLIVNLNNLANNNDIKLGLFGLNRVIKGIFNTTGIDSFIKIFKDEQQAISMI